MADEIVEPKPRVSMSSRHVSTLQDISLDAVPDDSVDLAKHKVPPRYDRTRGQKTKARLSALSDGATLANMIQEQQAQDDILDRETFAGIRHTLMVANVQQ